MSDVTLEIDKNGIGLLSINRPKVKNALNWATMEAFSNLIDQAKANKELRVLTLTGAAGAFISGGDLSVLQHFNSSADGGRLAQIMGDALIQLESLACITIAAINGPARGGGAEVAMACDLRVMSESASIGFVHVGLGIIPAWGGGQRLMRAIGYSRALDLIASGRIVNPVEALQLGVANVLAADALSRARELAGRFARNVKSATDAAKDALKHGLQIPYQEALVHERGLFPDLWVSDHRIESMRKFLGKTKPKIEKDSPSRA